MSDLDYSDLYPSKVTSAVLVSTNQQNTLVEDTHYTYVLMDLLIASFTALLYYESCEANSYTVSFHKQRYPVFSK